MREPPVCKLPECNHSVPMGGKGYQWRQYCCDEHAKLGKMRLNHASRTKRRRAAGILARAYFLINVDELRRLAADDLTITEIAVRMGKEWSSVQRCAARHGIQIRREQPYQSPGDGSDIWNGKSRDELLVALFGTELSYRDIAAEITKLTGHPTTKNAVVGRLHRLGLTGIRDPRPEPPPTPRVELPPPGHCQYAHGEEWPNYDWCGLRAEPGSAWCLAHRRVVYRPASPIDMRVAA